MNYFQTIHIKTLALGAIVTLSVVGIGMALNPNPQGSTTTAPGYTSPSVSPIPSSVTAIPRQPVNIKPAVASVATPYPKDVCVDTPVAYKTTYESVNYLKPGETTTYGGIDGKSTTCTGGGLRPTTYQLNPVDKVIRVGIAAPTPTSPTDNRIPLQQAQMNCARFNGSSAYVVCMNSYGY